MKTKTQLEMSLVGNERNELTVTTSTRRQRRNKGAHWWFTQMRQVVDRALDQQQDRPPRPEQIYFPINRLPEISIKG